MDRGRFFAGLLLLIWGQADHLASVCWMGARCIRLLLLGHVWAAQDCYSLNGGGLLWNCHSSNGCELLTQLLLLGCGQTTYMAAFPWTRVGHSLCTDAALQTGVGFTGLPLIHGQAAHAVAAPWTGKCATHTIAAPWIELDQVRLLLFGLWQAECGAAASMRGASCSYSATYVVVAWAKHYVGWRRACFGTHRSLHPRWMKSR